MRSIYIYITIFLITGTCTSLYGQVDTVPPLPPVLTLVSVQPETGRTLLDWISSPSPDVAGYVIYYFKNGGGFAIDTIHNPYAVQYLNLGSFASYLTESYVIAAMDSSKNTSALSNKLNTIFAAAQIDTCNKKIIISWNKYNGYPKAVIGYRVLASENGGSFIEAGITEASVNSLTISNFQSNTTYCFETVALLEGGFSSSSNKTCILTGIQKTPDWINADYASVDDKNIINLSFSVDPASEVNTYRLERKTENEAEYSIIAQIVSADKHIFISDKSGDPLKKNSYRLLAINNCGNPVVSSNFSGNIVLKIEEDGNNLILSWSPYKFWLGEVAEYNIMANYGSGNIELATVSSSDSAYSVSYASFMYDIKGNNICFILGASETGNPYGITGETFSAPVCSEIIENITVPNAFTPNNDLMNDFFKPVLSFTPSEYHLVITDRQNTNLFDSNDYTEVWEGKKNGEYLPQGVYLWFLKVKTPSGKQITRSGTVTIIK
jgi:gliding motility-associated-like protein